MDLFKMHHTHLICVDLTAMIDFWTKALNAKLIEMKRFGTADGATLELDGLNIYLRLAKEGETPIVRGQDPITGYDHIGLETKDFDSALKQMLDNGGRISSGPLGQTGQRIAFIAGPENILFELMEG